MPIPRPPGRNLGNHRDAHLFSAEGQDVSMKRLVPCLLATGLALAATGAAARVVVTGGNDDQRVTEGVSGPAPAARPENKADDKADNAKSAAQVAQQDKDRAKQKKMQHPPPPPLHDPN